MLGHYKLATYPVSFLAIVTPWWLPVLEQTSKYAAYILPIAGVAWIGLQAVLALHSHFRKRDGD